MMMKMMLWICILVVVCVVTSSRLLMPQKIKLFKNFHQIHGHVNIPLNYKIPTLTDQNPERQEEAKLWPKEAHGILLGTKAKHLRDLGETKLQSKHPQEFAILQSLGFSLNKTEPEITFYEKVELIEHYHWLYGHTQIPGHFVIPANDDTWPEKYANIALGKMALKLIEKHTRYQRLYPEEFQRLVDIGFSGHSVALENKYLQLFQTYYNLHQNINNIPKTYIVPNNTDEWPLACHNCRLGQLVTYMKYQSEEAYYQQRYPKVYALLRELNFQWDVKSRTTKSSSSSEVAANEKTASPKKQAVEGKREKHVQDTWIPVIEKYFELHKNLDIARTYITPVNDSNWPKELQNKKVGIFFVDVRDKGENYYRERYPRLYAVLQKLQFRWSLLHILSFPERVQVIQKYSQIYGDVDIQVGFSVPMDDERWPVEYRGILLGVMISYMRVKGRQHYLNEYREECLHLESMGFVWRKCTRLEFPEKVEALKCYYDLHGDLRMFAKFVVPDKSKHWPKKYWGLKLGTLLYNLRCSVQREAFKIAYPKEFEELTQMNFKWTPVLKTKKKKIVKK